MIAIVFFFYMNELKWRLVQTQSPLLKILVNMTLFIEKQQQRCTIRVISEMWSRNAAWRSHRCMILQSFDLSKTFEKSLDKTNSSSSSSTNIWSCSANLKIYFHNTSQ